MYFLSLSLWNNPKHYYAMKTLSKYSGINVRSGIFLLILAIHFPLFSQKSLTWNFPLPRTHTGALIGNGTQGLMIWGEENVLKITVGRAGFWDHRGGNPFASKATFQEVRRLLEAKDEKGLRELFAVPKKEGAPNLGRPHQIGGGRLDLTFPKGWKLIKADLNLENAELKITLRNPSGKEEYAFIKQASADELAWVDLPQNCKVSSEIIPSWNYVKDLLSKAGVSEPQLLKGKTTFPYKGFVQTLPEDDPLSLVISERPNQIVIATHLGKDDNNSLIIGKVSSFDLKTQLTQKNAFWKDYWTNVPKINLPDQALQEIVDYGLYKQACMTPPQGLAAGLQGSFNEEYQLPPWSNDYHFNINVQMIYTPVLASNRANNLMPLWNMMANWTPTLQENGEKFFGRKGALMLPHAVDDRCHVVGTFWTGTIDHACTAWMAYLAWQHYRYSMDQKILEKTAWTLLEGAFEGYWAMLEEVADGKGGTRFSLPVSVSPEYRGDRMNAWGRDASFQLAALHRIAKILPQAAKILGKPQDPRWDEVSRKLPPYTTVDDIWMEENSAKGTRIAMWEGQDLVGSHRHHSHLGSIFPFCTINPKSPEHQQIVTNSLRNWTFKGAGNWSGWCVPWASAIWSRNDLPEAAVNWLHYWKENYTNEGRGTLHNAAYQGVSLIADQGWFKAPKEAANKEVIQMDAGFGALTAVYELLVQNREDVIYVLPAIHRDWKDFSFENIGAEGAFQVSAKVKNGKVSGIKIKSLAGGHLKLAHNLGEEYLVNGKIEKGRIFEKECQPGELIVLKSK